MLSRPIEGSSPIISENNLMPDLSKPQRKPLIGVTGRRSSGTAIGSPHGFANATLDVYFSEYAVAIARAGGIPVHIALDCEPNDIVDHLDALVFSGGEDVDPRLYDQTPGTLTPKIDPHRDRLEIALFQAALIAEIPVLGICRGQQLINVALGGTLIQDLPVGQGESHASLAYPRDYRTHAIDIEPDSVMAEIYGLSAVVNSFHHQAVNDLGRGLYVTARATDGVIEAIELAGAPVIAVQWHPETFDADPIFDWLVLKSAAHDTIRKTA